MTVLGSVRAMANLAAWRVINRIGAGCRRAVSITIALAVLMAASFVPALGPSGPAQAQCSDISGTGGGGGQPCPRQGAPRPPSSGGGGYGGGGYTSGPDYGPLIGATIGVLGEILLGSGGGGGGGGQSCQSGYAPCGNGCAPVGSVCCGNLGYCPSSSICTKDGRCMERSSPSVCSDGRSYCSPGFLCTNEGKCLAQDSPAVCSNGRSYCAPGSTCTNEGKCLAQDSPRLCPDGKHYCDPGSMCTNDGECRSQSSASVCSDGRTYCDSDSICTKDLTCVEIASDRVCSDARSYCEPGYVCNSDMKCTSLAALEEEEQQRELEEAVNKAVEENANPFGDGVNPFAGGAAQQRNAASVARAGRENANPFDSSNPFARAGKGAPRGNCSDISGTGGPALDCTDNAAAASAPPAQTAAGPDGSGETCVLAEEVVAAVNSGGSAGLAKADPCVRIPGWKSDQPYNHSPKPARVLVWHAQTPFVLELPGATPGKKWGLWWTAKGPTVREWDGTGTEVNVRAAGDGDGCRVMVSSGWGSPVCEERRSLEQKEALQRKENAQYIPEGRCEQMGGKVFDPNQDTITEEKCVKAEGLVMFTLDNELIKKWNTSKGCSMPHGWHKLYDPAAPKRQCKVERNGRIDYYLIRELGAEFTDPFSKPIP